MWILWISAFLYVWLYRCDLPPVRWRKPRVHQLDRLLAEAYWFTAQPALVRIDGRVYQTFSSPLDHLIEQRRQAAKNKYAKNKITADQLTADQPMVDAVVTVMLVIFACVMTGLLI